MDIPAQRGQADGIRYPFDRPPERGEATEIAPGILWLRLPLPTPLDHVNVYALDDGDGWTVIDTGFDGRTTRAIWQAVLALLPEAEQAAWAARQPVLNRAAQAVPTLSEDWY